MLTGKPFKLERDTLAVDSSEGKRRAVSVPAGTILKVVSDPKDDDGLVDVLWDKRLLAMFEVDLIARGTEITDQRAGA